MASQITPNTIDGSYPIAGQDNNSQGFRDNFTSTVNNFVITAREINDLINKAVVTAPLTYGSSVGQNNLNELPLTGYVASDFSYGIAAHGAITTSGTLNFDFSAGFIHTASLSGDSITSEITVSNRPTVGYSEIRILLTISVTTQVFNLASFTNINAPNVRGYSSTAKTLSFNTAGERTLILGTLDGTNWDLTEFNSEAIAATYTPASSIGQVGDVIGAIAYDANFIYICSANYDGVTSIWRRSALTTF